MATITATAGGGNWNAGATWVGGIVPTANDDVLLTNTSGNVTINASAFCRSIDCTGYTGTLTHNASITLMIGAATAGPGNVALIFSTSMTYNSVPTSVTSLSFVSTAASVVQTIDFGGKTANGNIVFHAATTSGYQLVNNSMNCAATNSVTLSQGSFDTNNIDCTWGILQSAGSLVRSLTLGTSTITVLWNVNIPVHAPSNNMTVSAVNSTLLCTGNTMTINIGGGTNWGTIAMTGLGYCTLTASGSGASIVNFSRIGTSALSNWALQINTSFTITNSLTLTGASATNRMMVVGQIFIMRAFIMATGSTVTLANVDFGDVQFIGAGIPVSGPSLGNMGNNLGITFDTPVTQYWVGNGGNWSDASHWSTSSGGPANGRVPLPQDPVVIDANSITSSGQTVTLDMSRAGASWDFSGVNRSFHWMNNNVSNITVFGSVTFSPLMIRMTGTGVNVLGGRDTHTVTMAGNTFQGCIISAGTGTYTFQDSFNVGANLITITAGTLNTNNVAVGALGVVMNNPNNQKTLNLGSSTVTLIGNSANPVWNVITTLTTINADTSTIVLTNTGNYVRIFTGAGFVYNNLTYTAAGPPNQLIISGANTFNMLTVGPGRQLTLPAAATSTFNAFNVVGANYGYLYLPGQPGNYASAPHSSAVAITGDIDLQCRVALDSWTSGAQAFIVKEQNTGMRSYRFEINTQFTGRLTLVLSADGATQSVVSSSEATGFAPGVVKWVRATWRQSDGRVQFFSSDDGSQWTQMGTDQTIAIASIHNTTSPVEIGTRNTGLSFALAGKVYRAVIKNGIDGTTVFDADFSAKPFGANSFIESSSNAATVTINGALAQAGDGRVLIDSSVPGSAATVSKPTGYVTSDYIALKDSTATGGATWFAGANSVDASNNTGWNFTSGSSNHAMFMDFFD